MSRGAWLQGWVALWACVVTLGASWLVYPFFTLPLLRRHYLRRGWSEEPAEPTRRGARRSG
jgi:peptidoglycan/LPS O-acetylase OafA/YrhL